MLGSPETVVAFESPRRLPASLAALAALAPDRPAAVCRELTKLHEEVARGTLGELARRFRDEVKGEIVVVIGPATSAGAGPDVAFAVDALRRLVQSGARPAPPRRSSRRSPGRARTTSTGHSPVATRASSASAPPRAGSG